MNKYFDAFEFPVQRIPNNKKDKAWAAQCCDWVIAQATNNNRITRLENNYNILNGNIPDEFYKKILNPYNATQEKYKRFPATMRNYDLIRGIIRRYVSEYIKNPHDFLVGANNPEVVLAKNSKLRAELSKIMERQLAAQIQNIFQEYIKEGNDPKQFNLQEEFDVEAFIKEFNENYIDDISEQGQKILNVIKDITEDTLLYARAYFEYVSFGECYTYTDVVGEKLIKRNIAPIDAFPVTTDNMFREDDDMFACRRKLSYQQIIDEFDEYFTDKDREFLETYYAKHGSNTNNADLMFSTYESYFPDICKKFTDVDRNFYKENKIMRREDNSGLYDVWHVVWRGECRRAIVKFVNEAGFIDSRIENDDYKIDSSTGDLSIEYIYEPQVYECVRIGTRNDALYPYGARAIAYNRNGKLPYNGINELLPGFGYFSIIETVIPYQIFRNIIAYHREMAIAKNKLNILMIAKSLLGKVPEDTLYRMIADGTLLIDDKNDQGMIRAQQVKILTSNMGDYINQLTALMEDVKNSANEQVDMTPQRYGQIANSAGKAITEEAVMRGSMGTVIIEFMMDCMRERDYARDMDYSKFAWIDGLNTSYRDIDGNLKYISLDVDKHNYADYLIKAKNSVKENEKLQHLQEFAFSAAQNGDNLMALAAIEGDNVASISKLIKRFQKEKDEHEMQLKEMDKQLAQMEQEFELQKIAAKGEEDRKTKELEGYIDQQIELIKADANMLSFNNSLDESDKDKGIDRLNESRTRVDRERLNLEKQKVMIDAFNRDQDRKLKEKDIDTKLKIAKENKNKYDFKSKSKTKK